MQEIFYKTIHNQALMIQMWVNPPYVLVLPQQISYHYAQDLEVLSDLPETSKMYVADLSLIGKL